MPPKVSKAVKQYVNAKIRTVGEKKGIQTDHATAVGSGTASFVPITNIADGDLNTERSGEQVQLQSVHIKGSIRKGDTAATEAGTGLQSSICRVMLIRDNHGDGSIPVLTELFTTVNDFNLGKPHDADIATNQRFTVLMDKVFAFQRGGRRIATINYYKRLRGKCTFTGPNSTDEGKGWLYTIMATDDTGVNAVANVTSTVRFTDP